MLPQYDEIAYITERIFSNLRMMAPEHKLGEIEREREAARRSQEFWAGQVAKYRDQGKEGPSQMSERKRRQAVLWEKFCNDLTSALTPRPPAPAPLTGDALLFDVARRHGISVETLREEGRLEAEHQD